MNLTTEILIAVAIVGSTALQYGTRRADWRRLGAPLLIVVGFAFYYLKGFPTGGNDVLFVLAGAAAGVVLGAIAGFLVGVRRDDAGHAVLVAGIAYMALWIIVFAARLTFAVIAQNRPSTFRDLFVWAYQHGITELGWTDFFLLQALAMVGVRTLLVAARVLLLGPADGAESAKRGAVAVR